MMHILILYFADICDNCSQFFSVVRQSLHSLFYSRTLDCNAHHIRHCMLYDFQKGEKASAAALNNCTTSGEGSVTQRTCAFWFPNFVQETSHYKITPNRDGQQKWMMLNCGSLRNVH